MIYRDMFVFILGDCHGVRNILSPNVIQASVPINLSNVMYIM